MDANDPFVTDDDVLNNISDDMIYITELVRNEKSKGLNFLKESHLGRLVVVFTYNSIEAHRDFIARKIGATKKDIQWDKFFDNTELSPIFRNLIKTKTVEFNSIDEVRETLDALKALRDFISHGLVDGSAKSFEQKMKALESANLKIKPQKMTIADVDRVLDFNQKMTDLIGMAAASRTSQKSRANEPL